MKEDQIEVNRCTFKGKLSKGNHYIDGKLLAKEANKISVNSCTFDYDIKKAVNIEIVNESRSKKDTSFWNFVSNNLIEISFCVVAASAGMAFLVLRKKRSTESENDEKSNELQESLIENEEKQVL